MKRFCLATLCFLAAIQCRAQDSTGVWTLQSCLNYALEHNIQMQKSRVDELSGKEDMLQAKYEMFPSLSASVSQGFSNTPYTEMGDKSSYAGNYGANANWTLYNGGRQRLALKQSKVMNEINELSVEESANNIRVSIVQVYMQVMYATESVKINENTVETSYAQMQRGKALNEAGSISRVDYAQLESQYHTDKYQLVQAQNELANYKLQLKQLLELDITDNIEVSVPDINEATVLASLPEKETIYAASLTALPQIEIGKLSVKTSELQLQSTRAGFIPSVSLGAGIGTGHLSTSEFDVPKQFKTGLNENISLNVSIPIFSNRSNRTATNKAKYAIQTAQLDLQTKEKQVLKEVENSYLDVTSSQNQYISALERLKYVSQSYSLTEEQFNMGMKNIIELLTEKSNFLNAQQQVIQAKYMTVMNMQLLNIYQGKPVDTQF
ncbi:MAG: TolC family protein [Marinifilaceae bacterium]